jgi:hypothetical protein
MREAVSPRIGADLTVQTAMALSGAAFASASGTARVPANLMLALLNARLGTWLPRPRPIARTTPPAWWEARPPRIRRLSYLVREIFALHPLHFPMVFVTDGAHHEALGLVELLRHRCREIYCFDASSDDEAFAAAIGKAITLAYDELGVTVVLHDPESADPRGEDTEEGRDFVGRFATSPVLTATVTYPGRAPERDRQAVLVIGRATMDKDTPWQIREHAAAHPRFPRDVTGDQWFDDCKFNAYTGLGRYVGGLAVQAMLVQRATLAPRENGPAVRRVPAQPAGGDAASSQSRLTSSGRSSSLSR